ncbi:hypothetical protein J4Q44_G00169760 [Coregonus suidteri]|uniref:Macro domain-containing protein n=1 Tax=Coregonus suidteri TaxID=861788 RepID=A0AAN8LFE2_9TELE
MAKSLNIPLEEEMVSILGQCGSALTNVLQSKFGCTTVLHGVDANYAGQSRKPSIFPEERFSIHLSKSFKVSVWKDDLTTHRVDAVVNAANNGLKHYGGLAKALSDAGGPAIQQDSDQYIFSKGMLSTGDAIIAPPGYLPCRKIIHAVGPNLPYNPRKYDVDVATPQLQRAVLSILKVVKQDHLQSVAIPAISSGLFNYPLPLCADVIVKTLKEYHDPNYSGAPLEVRLVNHDEPSVREMERACRQILGSSGSHSQQVVAQGQSPKASYSPAASSHGKGSTKPFSTHTVQLGNVSLTVKKGCIEREKTLCIVNTISTDLNLSTGVISKAILKAAGQGIQKEIGNYFKNNPKSGDVIETQGHKLPCKNVYHTICPHKSEVSEKSLGDIVSKCLSMAQKRQLSSISFPAIGTGALGFSKQEVAKIMMDTAVTFAQHNNGMKMDIYYVIFPSDAETFKAFEDQLKSLQGATQHSSSSSKGFGHTTDQYESRATNEHRYPRGGASPYIELNSAHSDKLMEAKSWLTRAFKPSENFTIFNSFILHFGQREFDELLSLHTKWNVFIEEFFKDGRTGVNIQGASRGVRASVIELEAICCKVQEDFANKEELDMGLKSSNNFSRKPVEKTSSNDFSGLEIVRVEKVENSTLKHLFELKKRQLQSASSQRMYQRLPAQYCDLVSRVGFQREFAPPYEQKYGEGIYFSSSVHGTEKLWRGLADEEYLYFIEAQVLTGESTIGSPGLTVPPETPGGDPLSLYDSVKGGVDTCVIFNGHQALPEYLIICNKTSTHKFG